MSCGATVKSFRLMHCLCSRCAESACWSEQSYAQGATTTLIAVSVAGMQQSYVISQKQNCRPNCELVWCVGCLYDQSSASYMSPSPC